MDLNGDGQMDILSGSYSHPDRRGVKMAGTFEVFWGSAEGKFDGATTLQGINGEPLVILADIPDLEAIDHRICTRPFAVDWDGDGHIDIVSGSNTGRFHLFRGEGGGRFSGTSSEITDLSGTVLEVPGNSDPCIVDWDGDGDLDILSGSEEGGVYLAENSAGRGKQPALESFRAIIEPVGLMPPPNFSGMPRSLGAKSRVWATDLNKDGKLDLLIGDKQVFHAPASDELSEEEASAQYVTWASEYERLFKLLDTAEADARTEINEQRRKAWKKLTDAVNRHGGGAVWAYIRK